jgi:hypothetical protein
MHVQMNVCYSAFSSGWKHKLAVRLRGPNGAVALGPSGAVPLGASDTIPLGASDTIPLGASGRGPLGQVAM